MGNSDPIKNKISNGDEFEIHFLKDNGERFRTLSDNFEIKKKNGSDYTTVAQIAGTGTRNITNVGAEIPNSIIFDTANVEKYRVN